MFKEKRLQNSWLGTVTKKHLAQHKTRKPTRLNILTINCFLIFIFGFFILYYYICLLNLFNQVMLSYHLNTVYAIQCVGGVN